MIDEDFNNNDDCRIKQDALVQLRIHQAYTPSKMFEEVTTAVLETSMKALKQQRVERIREEVVFVLRWHKWRAIQTEDDPIELSKIQESFRRVKNTFASILESPARFLFFSVSRTELDCIPADAKKINELADQIKPPRLDDPLAQDILACKIRNLWGSMREPNSTRKCHFWRLQFLKHTK